MATRNLVPRNSGEGSVGRVEKAWATGVFDNLYIRDIELSMDQNVRTSDNVEFVSGNFISGLTLAGVDITGLQSTIDQAAEVAAEFCFFSNVENNIGVASKDYHATPTQDTFLSGFSVASAEDLKVYFQWDGPNDDYIGSGFINGQQIPISNIQQVGSGTRRFIGYIDNLNATGLNFITGEANGRQIKLSVTELGGGPTPTNISIDEIGNATPKPGELLGSTHLKEGDQINIFVDFNTNDVDLIKVHNFGLAKEIDFANYQIQDINGTFRATIPVEVSPRNGNLSVAIQAINSFGSTGELKESSDFNNNSGARDLDQAYPIISAISPTDYNGRQDGLRESENASITNSILNWSDGIDFIEYQALTSEISIQNPQSFEADKAVSYENGIFNNEDNVQIFASRTANGSTDTETLKVKIANGPVVTGVELSSSALSATSPNIIGSSEVKAGDVVESKVFIKGNGVSMSDISISVLNSGASNGQQQSYSSSYAKTQLPDGSFEFNVPIKIYGVLGNPSRDGAQAITVKCRNNFQTQGDDFTSSESVILNNGIIPILSINSVTYPGSQQAIKNGDSVTVFNNASNFDTISYSSPQGQLLISNSSTFESEKSISYSTGGYNIEGDGGVNNLKIGATKSSNGATTESFKIVNIANSPLTLSINNLAPSLSSSPNGASDQFYMSSSQLMLSSPTLSTDVNQTNPSSLNQNSSGTGKSNNSYTITVSDLDTKGTFAWQVSATNLANITTTSISSSPNYKLAGFSPRTISASPNSLGAGLADIGTTVSNPNNLTFENISEGGSAPNGGTAYIYQPYSDGVQLNNTYDLNNKFAVCNSSGVTDSDGNYVFNLDKLNRSANTSTSNPASFVISE